MYRTIREQDDHLVQLALERNHAVLELDQVKLELTTVRAENENLHAQLPSTGKSSRRTVPSTRPRPGRP